MFIWEKNFKYLKAQQVSQQISIFFKSKFHNEGGDCQKSYFEVFFSQGSHMSPPKISTLTDPPSHFLPISPRFLTNISCGYFSLNISVVYNQLELDWCIFDQNWAKTRPYATDRRIVQWVSDNCKQWPDSGSLKMRRLFVLFDTAVMALPNVLVLCEGVKLLDKICNGIKIRISGLKKHFEFPSLKKGPI